MSFTYQHIYRIERDKFLILAEELGWEVVPFKTVLRVCWPREVRPDHHYRVCQYQIGIYLPSIGHFYTNAKPKQARPNVVPDCDCCRAA